MVGCLGTARLSGGAGGPMRADFSLFGALEGSTGRKDISPATPFTTGVLATSPAYPTLKSAAFAIGASNYAPRIANVGFDLGNTVNPIESINSTGAVAGFKIFDRNPRLSIDPEADTETAIGWYAALFTGGPLMKCNFQLGSTQYNKVLFQFAAGGVNTGLQLVQQSLGARDGLTMLPSTLLATIINGEDDFAIVFA
jgi:hypothetical protein